MTKEKRSYCINVIIPDLKKAGVTLQQIQGELDYREMNQIFDGRDGLDEDFLDYSTEELADAETLWVVQYAPEDEMRHEVLQLLKISIARRYGNLEDNRGCYVNDTWLSVAEIVKIIDHVDENAVKSRNP